MAQVAFVQAGTGWIVTTGTGNGTLAGTTAGNLIIVQTLADGTGLSATITVAAGSNVENLAGTDNALTRIDSGLSPLNNFNQCGNPAAAYQTFYCGRSLGGTVTVTSAVGGSGNDTYNRIYEFSGAHAGTGLTDVFESPNRDFATGTTVNDVGVTTTVAECLACNFVGIDDDATGLAAFAGETGGDWTLATAIFESATGTDGTIALMIATMASAGTIIGGSDTITSDNWGVVGFAIKPVPAAPFVARPIMVEHLSATGRASLW